MHDSMSWKTWPIIKILLLIFAISLLPAYAAPREDLCAIVKTYPLAVHLGNEKELKYFVPLWKNPHKYENNFTVPAALGWSNLSFNVYETNQKNSILVNDQFANWTCINTSQTWAKCTVRIPPELFRIGLNSLSFKSDKVGNSGNNFDDFMISNVLFQAEYAECYPRVVATKTYSPLNPYFGDQINVTLLFTNIGYLPATNISFSDKPLKLGVITGLTNGSIELLATGNVLRVEYTVNSSRLGAASSEEGIVRYHDDLGNNYSAAIPPMAVFIKPQVPRLMLMKNSSAETVNSNEKMQITLLAVNAGDTDVFNVSIVDYLAENITLVDGSPNLTIPVLKRLENMSYGYAIKANGSFLLSSAAYMTYQDPIGDWYNTTSNHIELIGRTGVMSTTLSVPLVLTLFVGGIAVLSVVALVLRRRA